MQLMQLYKLSFEPEMPKSWAEGLEERPEASPRAGLAAGLRENIPA